MEGTSGQIETGIQAVRKASRRGVDCALRIYHQAYWILNLLDRSETDIFKIYFLVFHAAANEANMQH